MLINSQVFFIQGHSILLCIIKYYIRLRSSAINSYENTVVQIGLNCSNLLITYWDSLHSPFYLKRHNFALKWHDFMPETYF